MTCRSANFAGFHRCRTFHRQRTFSYRHRKTGASRRIFARNRVKPRHSRRRAFAHGICFRRANHRRRAQDRARLFCETGTLGARRRAKCNLFKKRLPTLSGSRENPLSSLSKWKLLKTLANALVPVCTLSLLLVGAFFAVSEKPFCRVRRGADPDGHETFGRFAARFLAGDFCAFPSGGSEKRCLLPKKGFATPRCIWRFCLFARGRVFGALPRDFPPVPYKTAYARLGHRRRQRTVRRTRHFLCTRFVSASLRRTVVFAPFTAARFFALFFLFARFTAGFRKSPIKRILPRGRERRGNSHRGRRRDVAVLHALLQRTQPFSAAR